MDAQTYRLGDVLAVDETRVLELKEIAGGNPVRTIADTAPRYTVAFLNTDGGRILWGVQDEARRIVGVRLNASQRDELSQLLSRRMGQIQPAVDPTLVRLSFLPVIGGDELFVVELVVPKGRMDQSYCVGDRFYVRLDGLTQELAGSALKEWLRGRHANSQPIVAPATDSAALALAQRVRLTLRAHGLEPAHVARFMEQRQAPFSLGLTDLQSDASLLRWLDDERLDWLASTFRIRREWLDGEDGEVHERFHFDKQPEKFFSFARALLDEAPAGYEDTSWRYAYFIRTAKGNRWLSAERGDVIVVLATPIAYLNSENVVMRYASDLTAYPWDYGRTRIQLRAWARLLFVELGFTCLGMRADAATIDVLQARDQFLGPLLSNGPLRRAHDWAPEDFGLYQSESRIAKEHESMTEVEDFLKEHGLPCSPSWGAASRRK